MSEIERVSLVLDFFNYRLQFLYGFHNIIITTEEEKVYMLTYEADKKRYVMQKDII